MTDIIKIKTDKIGFIVDLIGTLNGSVHEANMEIKKNTKQDEENNGEIKIFTTDQNQVMITSVTLRGAAFDIFEVLPETYNIGINLDELYKFIKNVDKNGILTITLNSDDTQYIIFNVVSSTNSSPESTCELRVLNLVNKRDRQIELDIKMAARINCKSFHKACKDLSNFSQYVEITCDPTKLTITCKGDMSNQDRKFKVGKDKVHIRVVENEDDKGIPDIIRLLFDLKYINLMAKVYTMCTDMIILLKNDSVMFFKYEFDFMMGEMLIGIAPSNIKKENISKDKYSKTVEDDEEDDFYEEDDEIKLR